MDQQALRLPQIPAPTHSLVLHRQHRRRRFWSLTCPCSLNCPPTYLRISCTDISLNRACHFRSVQWPPYSSSVSCEYLDYRTIRYPAMTMSKEPPTKRKCLGADCDQDASDLQCPTCMKLDIKDSYFCSQQCFTRNWVSEDLLPLLFLPAQRQLSRSSARKHSMIYDTNRHNCDRRATTN